MWGLFCYVFLIIILRPLRGGGKGKSWRSTLLKKWRRGLFTTFFSMCFFSTLFTMWEPFCYFFLCWKPFLSLWRGGAFFGLPLLLKLLLFIFVNKVLALKFILCRIPIVANCISTRVTLFFIPFDSNIIWYGRRLQKLTVKLILV